MDIGNNGLRVRDIALQLRNDDMGAGNNSVCVCDVAADIRNYYVRAYRKFGLEADSQRWLCVSDRTHIKHMKDPAKIQSPGHDRLSIVLRVEHPGDPISFTPLDDALLDLCHGPAIGNFVSE